jgi:DNA (cytosine-5)-methyltransferase 1
VVDVFAGCGGFSLGFSEAGHTIVAAVENHRIACETYARNVPVGFVLDCDARKVEPADIPPFDVLIGGPPCEGFTVANASRRARPLDRLYQDPRGSLTLQFILLLKALKPRAFIMENVPQILDGPLEAELRMLFGRAGYPVHFHIVEASEHGVPSRRRRVFASNLPLRFPPPLRPRTVREAIRDLEELDPAIPNHIPAPLRGKRAREVPELGGGESLYQYRAADGRVHGHITRIRGDEVAPTIKGLGRYVHYDRDRLLSPREHARLMGYPDDFVFQGSRTEEYDQVGESVPPPLAKILANAVGAALEGAPQGAASATKPSASVGD